MRVRTVLNYCHSLKCFVYARETIEEYKGNLCVIVDIRPRKNSRIICSGCHQPSVGYDHQPQPRYFEFVPLWGLVV